jgi:SOS response regulatory protein OraA/RecX
MFKLIKEITHLKESTEDEKFLDKVWQELINLGIDESRIEKAFSGQGAGQKIEDIYQDMSDDLSDSEKKNPQSAKKVAKALASRFKNYFKPSRA